MLSTTLGAFRNCSILKLLGSISEIQKCYLVLKAKSSDAILNLKKQLRKAPIIIAIKEL